jgi:hypothetical protein
MKTLLNWPIVLTTLVTVFSVSCDKEEPKSETSPKHSAPKTPTAVPTVAPTPPPPAPAAPPVDCPAGSEGEGSFDKPCEATGAARMMEVTWTGKMDDKGPTFRVINKSKTSILHGKVVVYYYDKAGKQIEIPPVEGIANSKSKPYHSCSGNIFAGAVKPEEKVFLTFSCVKKDRVPEGTKAIEAEIQTVGFADDTEKKTSYYWRNNDLTPDQRPKGGVKAKKK